VADSLTPPTPDAQTPRPPSERGAWLLALALGLLGVGVITAVLTGVVGGAAPRAPTPLPPTALVAEATPVPGASASASALAGAAAGAGAVVGSGRAERSGKGSSGAAHGGRRARSTRRAAIVARPTNAEQGLAARRLVAETETEIPTRWMEGFYPIYATAQRTFGVNWLLIASIHKQESAFSTAPTTYHGLNFAGCCGGPMQFNVTNGPVSTWALVSSSYRYGRRPAAYDHMTATHPSIYDDFDAIMAAAHLLSADGAEYALDGAAWDAAYDYYGHDATGVSYADEVLARAIGWSQHSFCINCGVEPGMIEAVHAAYGAPVLALLTTATTARARK